MKAEGFVLFDTALGVAGLAWSASGVASAQLPGLDGEAVRRQMQQRHPDAIEGPPPPAIAAAAAQVQALLAEGKVDLADIPLDMSAVEPFARRVYEIARAIPPGRTRTYGEIAREMGDPKAAQAVGAALGRNPFAPIVPCHRVLAAGGRTGGFSAPGGVKTKLRMLAIENARVGDAPTLF